MSCVRNCPYQPHEGSLPDKVIGWLECNGGRLTAAQIAEHFNVNSNDVSGSLRYVVAHGALKRVKVGARVFFELGAP
jgi:hypothetical protein